MKLLLILFFIFLIACGITESNNEENNLVRYDFIENANNAIWHDPINVIEYDGKDRLNSKISITRNYEIPTTLEIRVNDKNLNYIHGVYNLNYNDEELEDLIFRGKFKISKTGILKNIYFRLYSKDHEDILLLGEYELSENQDYTFEIPLLKKVKSAEKTFILALESDEKLSAGTYYWLDAKFILKN